MTEELVMQPEPQEAGTEPFRRILIVDDDQDQALALQHRLGKLGYRTRVAHSGRAAMEATSAQPPDLVLLDLRLPDTDGLQVCARLSDSPMTCGIPIIIVTAMESPSIIREARSAGCEFYLRKPYDPNALLALIENALEKDDETDW